jgi:hypothetical protein
LLEELLTCSPCQLLESLVVLLTSNGAHHAGHTPQTFSSTNGKPHTPVDCSKRHTIQTGQLSASETCASEHMPRDPPEIPLPQPVSSSSLPGPANRFMVRHLTLHTGARFFLVSSGYASLSPLAAVCAGSSRTYSPPTAVGYSLYFRVNRWDNPVFYASYPLRRSRDPACFSIDQSSYSVLYDRSGRFFWETSGFTRLLCAHRPILHLSGSASSTDASLIRM